MTPATSFLSYYQGALRALLPELTARARYDVAGLEIRSARYPGRSHCAQVFSGPAQRVMLALCLIWGIASAEAGFPPGAVIDIRVGDNVGMANPVSRVVIECAQACAVTRSELLDAYTQRVVLTGVSGELAASTSQKSAVIEQVALSPVPSGSILTIQMTDPGRVLTTVPCGTRSKICLDLLPPHAGKPGNHAGKPGIGPAAVEATQRTSARLADRATTNRTHVRSGSGDTRTLDTGQSERASGLVEPMREIPDLAPDPAIAAILDTLEPSATGLDSVRVSAQPVLKSDPDKGSPAGAVETGQAADGLPFGYRLQSFIDTPLDFAFCAAQSARLQDDAWDMEAHKHVAICKAAMGAPEEADGLIIRQMAWSEADTELQALRAVFAAIARHPPVTHNRKQGR